MATHFTVLAATTLLLLLSHSPTPTTGDTNTGIGSEAVLDIEGNPLEANSEYYILPVVPGFTGGLILEPLLCPRYVIASPSYSGLGSPVKFIPVGTPDDDRLGQIHLSSNVIIDSGFSPICRNRLVWSVSSYLPLRLLLIVADGASYTPPALFKINKALHVRFAKKIGSVAYTASN
ncbi:hypothetical protein Cgig2_015480 [Carnegiea gigantea]|uniref:Uncharacterized protein n=1 Tax=Carnegiea gigantea TaxID=171969 RepID=A0A9Q1JKC9_9CARY|nr:hypothetical protein Cgig2_015480 [Carnegiea gigantea]